MMLVTSDLRAEAIARNAAENSLYEFTKQAWHLIEGEPFVENWHIQAIAEHLEAAINRDILQLLINAPPRSSKTILLSVMLPAWVWLRNPSERFMYISYGSDLSNDNSRRCRQILQSEWYTIRWGHIYNIVSDQNAKERFDNDKNGYRLSTSMTSSSTGFGATAMVFDDPNNAKEIESQTALAKTNSIFSGAFSTRFNNLSRDILIVNQQRLGEMDLSGYIIANDHDNSWTKLILPLEFEEARKCKTIILPSSHGKVWEDPRKTEGEILCPTRFPKKALKRLKDGLGSEYRIAGQLQQRPAPQEGGLLKRTWFQWWKESSPPPLLQIVQSWDTALETKKTSCYSACTTWGIFNDKFGILNVILLGLYRGKIEMPDLVEMAKRLYKDYRDDGQSDVVPDGHHVPDLVLIEAKANGISLIQTIRRMGIPTSRVDPSKFGGDKELRVKLISHLVQAGRVWVPANKPEFVKLKKYADIFVENCAMFPAGESADIVDSFSQMMHRLKSDGLVSHPQDEDWDDPGYVKKGSHGYW